MTVDGTPVEMLQDRREVPGGGGSGNDVGGRISNQLKFIDGSCEPQMH